MSLADYFASIKGTGVLATSDSDGNVDVAIYARPYFIDDNTIAFSMLEKRTYANIKSNPKAAYMFIEEGEGHVGKRIHLTMTGEEHDKERIKHIKHMHSKSYPTDEKIRHFVYFTIDKVRPLVGDKY
jgi:hypothetical protein